MSAAMAISHHHQEIPKRIGVPCGFSPALVVGLPEGEVPEVPGDAGGPA